VLLSGPKESVAAIISMVMLNTQIYGQLSVKVPVFAICRSILINQVISILHNVYRVDTSHTERRNAAA